MLPGYTFNRRFMEQMMGVKERLAEATAVAPARAPFRRRLLDALRLAASVAGLAANYLRLRSKTAAFQQRLEDALRTRGPALPALPPDRLVAAFQGSRTALADPLGRPLGQ